MPASSARRISGPRFLLGALLTVFLLAPQAAVAQGARLTADLETAPIETREAGFFPLGSLGERFLFAVSGSGRSPLTGSDELHGGLYISDGTAAGTRLLQEGCDNCQQSSLLGVGERGAFVILDGFSPDRDYLMITDGTVAGTRALQRRVGSAGAFEPESGRAFFSVIDNVDADLWVSDGTVAGTRKVPGLPATVTRILKPTAWDGAVYFTGNDDDGDLSLWVSDGTAAGTRQLVDLPPRFEGSPYAPNLAPTESGMLFFRYDGPGALPELWITDGTPGGTRPLAEPATAQMPELPMDLRPMAGGHVFAVGEEDFGRRKLWFSDGTPAGTVPLLDYIDTVGDILTVGERGFLVIDETLWVSDGTPAGTHDLFECGLGRSCLANGQLLTSFEGDSVLFYGESFEEGANVWVSDGTVLGHKPLFEDGLGFSYQPAPWGVEIRPGEAVFSFDPTVFPSEPEPEELYFTDGTSLGTERIATFSDRAIGQGHAVGDGLALFPLYLPSPGGFLLGATDGRDVTSFEVYPRTGTGWSAPQELLALGGGLAFVPGTGVHRGDLYAVPPGSETPRLLVDAEPISERPSGRRIPVELAGELYLLAPADGESDYQLWKAGAGLQSATSVTRLPEDSVYFGPVSALGRLFWWTADLNSFATDLWTSDGTAAGTRLLAAGVGPSATSRMRLEPGVLGGFLYFLGADASLWRTDGTTTEVVAPLEQSHPVYADTAGSFFPAGDQLFFFAGESHIPTLWVTGGSAETTRRLLPTTSVYPNGAALYDGVLYFAAFGQGTGRELWGSDGTDAGTYLLKDLRPGTADSNPASFTPFAGLLYFLAEDDPHGHELWVTDGTEAGTRLAVDLYPGPAGSRPMYLTTAAGRLLWSATSGPQGQEMWSLEAGSSEPGLLTDIVPGPRYSEPGPATAAGDRLFFPAFHPDFGRELWTLPADAAPIGGCSTGPLDLCLLGGRVRVQVTWTDQRSGKSGVGTPVPYSDKTGLFWFFDDANIELVVKALDGTAVNGHLWGFYGALSDVIYTVEMTDTETGEVRRFQNPAGEICGGADTTALPVDTAQLDPGIGGGEVPGAVTGRWLPLPVAPGVAARAAGTCAPDAETLCLLDGRFAVSVEWDNQRAAPGEPNDAGTGQVIPSLGDGDKSGYFWFFDSANIELVVKALDGTPLNGHYWFFYGALSDVEYTITVRDTVTGAVQTYHNEPGDICGGADNRAFPE